MHANIGLFHFYFLIKSLVPLLFIPPSPLIPIFNQFSRLENVLITCFLNFWADVVLLYACVLLKHIDQIECKNLNLCESHAFVLHALNALASNASALILLTAACADLVTTF